jgi:hypothetical protein
MVVSNGEDDDHDYLVSRMVCMQIGAGQLITYDLYPSPMMPPFGITCNL